VNHDIEALADAAGLEVLKNTPDADWPMQY